MRTAADTPGRQRPVWLLLAAVTTLPVGGDNGPGMAGRFHVRVAHTGRFGAGVRAGAYATPRAAAFNSSAKGSLMPLPRFAAHRPRRAFGLTLLELLAVIVILAALAFFAVRWQMGRVDARTWEEGKIGVTRLDQDVQAYVLDNGSPPKSLQGLLTKPPDAPSWNGPYAKPADLIDPFGHPYGYVYPGRHGQYEIIFYGRDGKPGGTGVNRDYGNWQ